ncbi:MAG: MFS transporter [Proteobacteria bacterium]|nr:MFS transporter [Pseudomonadota bacterium]MDA1331709.1 MFS transporter [Pseudomonadota bacterium]
MTSLFGRLSNFYFWYFAFVGAFGPFFALYLQRRGFAPLEIAVLLGISPTLRIIVPFFWAWLADHWGHKYKLLRILAFISPVLFALMIAKGSFFSVAGVLIIWGLLWSGILPIAEALCVEALGEEISIYGQIRVWGSIGFILVVVSGGYLFEWLDVLYLDWIICAMLLIILSAVLMLPRDNEAPVCANELAKPIYFLKDQRIIALMVCFFIMQFAHGAYNTFFSIFVVSLGHSNSTVGWLWAIAVIAEIFIFLLMPRLFKRFSINDLFLFCFFIAACRFFIFHVGHDSLMLLAIAQMMHAITFGLFHVAGIVATNKLFTGAYRSRGQALYSSIGFGAGGASGTLVSGVVWENWGGAATFAVSALTSLLGLILILWLRNRFDG